METAALSLPRYAEMVKVLERIWQHRYAVPSDSSSDLLYYELLLKYNRRVLTARDEGKPLIATGIYVPNEIIYALDIVPLHLENVPITYAILMAEGEELLSTAKSFGLPPEVCSNHRTIAAFFLRRLAPEVDGVVWTHLLCDNTAKIGELIAETCQVRSFFLDRPYRNNERGISYLVGELEGLVTFLESLSGKRLNTERLEAAIDCSRQMVTLSQEMDSLRKESPSPLSNRKIYQLLFVNWLYSGSPEAVQFYRAVRDEALARRGLVPVERHRILSLFVAPNYGWKLLDWMERDKGARIVADPYHCHWGEWTHDTTHLLASLARKMLATPACKQLHGPADEFIKDCLEDARNFRARAAIYWAHLGCRQACGAIRLIKDALRDSGIPTLVLDCDITDPSVVSLDSVKEKMDAFFEVLEER